MKTKKFIASLFILSVMLTFCSCRIQIMVNKSSDSSDSSSSKTEVSSKLFKGVKSSFNDNCSTYKNDYFNFSVTYPNSFKTQIEDYKKATSSEEGSPDGGITIFIKESTNDTIRVFGSNGKIDERIIDFSYTAKTTEDFITDSKTKGTLYYNAENGTTNAVLLLDDHHAAQINCSNETFSRCKQQIFAILKSIKIN